MAIGQTAAPGRWIDEGNKRWIGSRLCDWLLGSRLSASPCWPCRRWRSRRSGQGRRACDVSDEPGRGVARRRGRRGPCHHGRRGRHRPDRRFGGGVDGRQPAAAGQISTAMIITAAMIEGATLFAVVVGMMAVLKA